MKKYVKHVSTGKFARFSASASNHIFAALPERKANKVSGAECFVQFSFFIWLHLKKRTYHLNAPLPENPIAEREQRIVFFFFF